VVAADPGRVGRADGLRPGLTLIVLGGGPAQRHAIDAARRLGAATVVCDIDPSRGDVAVSSEDTEGVLAVARERGADGLIAPGTDWPVRVAAAVAAELGLPHPISLEVAERCTDKVAQRTALQAAGVDQPEWSTTQPPGYPCVVKVGDQQGQRAMTILPSADGLPAARARAHEASRTDQVLFERFVPGPEVTVNGFVVDGTHHPVAVTDRVHFDGAPGVARRHVYPSTADSAAAAATAAVHALGIGSGPTYTQLIMSEDGPSVMEVAARLGGGHDSELVLKATGVDLAAAAVRAALGIPVDEGDLAPSRNRACVVEFLQAPPGVLRKAAGPSGATFYHAPGHRYGPLAIATDRAGYVIAGGQSRAEALERAAEAVHSVVFEVT
jgi:biotin carboxylase